MTTPAETHRLMQGVIPYITLDGAEAAIAFYVRAFGAVQHGETNKVPDGRVLNAGLEINGGMLMLNDPFPEQVEVKSASPLLAPVTLQLVVSDGAMWWSRAVEAGCTVVLPYDDAFWGGKYGQVRDPYGYLWAIHEPAAT